MIEPTSRSVLDTCFRGYDDWTWNIGLCSVIAVRATGSRERAPDDRLREAIQLAT
jgi:hypothetical protein